MSAEQPLQESDVLKAIDNMIQTLRRGLQEPFVLYTPEVLGKLMKDIPAMDQTPQWSMLQTIPNCGKIYYGEDLQMVEILKSKQLEAAGAVESLIDWCAQWADLVVRTQYKQQWCQGEVAKCVRMFRDQLQVSDQFTKNTKVCVTFDSLCGTAFIYKNSTCNVTKQLILDNFMDMVSHAIQLQEAFIVQIRQEYQKSKSSTPQN